MRYGSLSYTKAQGPAFSVVHTYKVCLGPAMK